MRIGAIMLASLCGCGPDRLPDETGWYQQLDLGGPVSLHASSAGVLLQRDQHVTLLKGEDGSRVWTQQIPGAISTNADGDVFSDDGVAFRHYAADSGELVWEVSADPPSSSPRVAANTERVASVRSVWTRPRIASRLFETLRPEHLSGPAFKAKRLVAERRPLHPMGT